MGIPEQTPRDPEPGPRRPLGMGSVWLCVLLCLASGPQAAPLAGPNLELRQGERMYREGILPSGAPMTGTVRGDVAVEGSAFACTSCHLRSGLGSTEGGVVTPPTNAEKLYRPWYRYHPALVGEERQELAHQFRDILRRPAYTDADLARAITEGLDPMGRSLNDIMPRYALSGPEADVLVRYLKGLSAEPSPGVSPTRIAFATIVTDEVSPEDRQDFLEVLRYRVAARNRLGVDRDSRGYRAIAAWEGALAFREWSLSVWTLKGPLATWAAQLDAHYRREPIFAILSGLSYRSWKPIHTFCEARKIPCILPLTDQPFLNGEGWYTLYFSKGPFQEGEAAAAYLSNLGSGIRDRPILQVVADRPEARQLARGFDSSWADHGHAPVRTLHLRHGESLDAGALRRRAAGRPSPVVLLWTGPEAYASLAALTNRPESLVMLSSSLLGRRLWELPQAARERVWLTYPYRLLRPPTSMKAPEGTPQDAFSQVSLAVGDSHRRVRSRVFTVMKSMTEAFSRMGRNFYRDNLLDAYGMMMDDQETDYERLSFGPGQRFASKGCYVVQLPRGPLHGFLKRSDWVIH